MRNININNSNNNNEDDGGDGHNNTIAAASGVNNTRRPRWRRHPHVEIHGTGVFFLAPPLGLVVADGDVCRI